MQGSRLNQQDSQTVRVAWVNSSRTCTHTLKEVYVLVSMDPVAVIEKSLSVLVVDHGGIYHHADEEGQ